MTKASLKKRSPARAQTVVKQASLDDSCKVNSRKPYQFKPGNQHGKRYRWRPGQCGNPDGRPKVDRGIRDITKEFGEQYNPKMGMTRDEHLLAFLYRRGCQGNIQAAKLYLAYRFGNPVTPLEHSGGIDLAGEVLRARMRVAEARERAQREQAPLPAETPTETPRVETHTTEQGPDDAEQSQPATARRRIVVM